MIHVYVQVLLQRVQVKSDNDYAHLVSRKPSCTYILVSLAEISPTSRSFSDVLSLSRVNLDSH